MKILVTGGAGFIGSAVVRHIINNTQDSVVNVDKLTYAGNLESLADVSDSERYFFEHADICDAAAMARIFAQHQPDAVMHLAAESHVDRSITGPAAFIETNIVGTYVLLEAARNYWSGLDDEKKKNFRFHHISTDEVYGDLPHPDEVNSNETLPLFTETTAYAPSSPYSASKASSDHLVRAWKRTHYQLEPYAQGKLVRCVVGEVFDVAVDIRKSSPTFGKWVGVNLSAENKRQLWIPEGFAHGFLVLSDLAEVLYKTNQYYAPSHEKNIIWNDLLLNIKWPSTALITLSDKDANGERFELSEF